MAEDEVKRTAQDEAAEQVTEDTVEVSAEAENAAEADPADEAGKA